MARTMKDRTIPEVRWTFRLPKVWADIIDAEVAARNAALAPDERKISASTLTREALADRFNLPSVAPETDAALETVSA